MEPPSARIVIVTIDETDITRIRQWPIPDAVLARAIKNIKDKNPRTIGLDLYRDLPVEPGHQELVKTFETTPNLIGIEKVVGSRIAPPPMLNQLEQVGFVDVVLDADGKVRRGLLSLEYKNQLHLSLSLQLALKYLKAEAVIPKQVDEIRWQLGRTIFAPFKGNDGGYVGADAGGYQILLNFRGMLHNFETISFADVLENRISLKSIANRVVLIGTVAESLNDFFYTPYSSSLFHTPKPTPGVVIHANLVSHLLSAALDKRPTIQVWSDFQEWLWILAWSMIGVILNWRLKSIVGSAIAISLAVFVLVFSAYLAFLYGWWLPIVPPLLGLIGSALVLGIIIHKQLEQLQLEGILDLLLKECATSQMAGRIAIEYLKQSESDANQAAIEQWLNDNNLR